jgi:hypothetical protein
LDASQRLTNGLSEQLGTVERNVPTATHL